MNRLLESVSHLSFSFLGNALLVTVAAGISLSGLGLSALYLIEHVDETPSMKSLQCMVGVSRPDCPQHAQEMRRLKDELDDMAAARNEIEGRLAGLRAVETAVDEITLFETHLDPGSGLEVTVGTVYKEFVNAKPAPDSYFCYINLHQGSAGVSRNLHFHGRSGEFALSASKLRQAGVHDKTLAFARSVCKPYLIGTS